MATWRALAEVPALRRPLSLAYALAIVVLMGGRATTVTRARRRAGRLG